MLLNFSVSNLRSIGKEQTLTMEASKPRKNSTNPENIMETGFKHNPYTYRTGIIFGANASGKSNIIHAMADFRYLVANSTKYDNYNDDDKPFTFDRDYFKLDPAYKDLPTSFKLEFISEYDKTPALFTYSLTINDTEVIEEHLTVLLQKDNARTKTLINRQYMEIKLNKDLATGTSGYKDNLLKHHLLLTYIPRKTQNTALNKVYSGIAKKLLINDNNDFPHHLTTKMIRDEKLEQKDIIQFLQNADLHIADLISVCSVCDAGYI